MRHAQGPVFSTSEFPQSGNTRTRFDVGLLDDMDPQLPGDYIVCPLRWTPSFCSGIRRQTCTNRSSHQVQGQHLPSIAWTGIRLAYRWACRGKTDSLLEGLNDALVRGAGLLVGLALQRYLAGGASTQHRPQGQYRSWNPIASVSQHPAPRHKKFIQDIFVPKPLYPQANVHTRHSTGSSPAQSAPGYHGLGYSGFWRGRAHGEPGKQAVQALLARDRGRVDALEVRQRDQRAPHERRRDCLRVAVPGGASTTLS